MRDPGLAFDTWDSTVVSRTGFREHYPQNQRCENGFLTTHATAASGRTRCPRIPNQADFFRGKMNGITFPYSSGGIHFRAFLLKLSGMKN